MYRTRAIALVLLLTFASPATAPAQTTAGPPRGNHVLTVTPEPLVGGVGGVAVDRMGDIYIADFRETVYKITPDGRASVFATGLYGASGNAIDSRGNLLQSNFNGNFVTRIDRHGNQKIIVEGLNGPVGIAVDVDDSFYVVNCRSNSVSKATDSEGAWSLAEFARSDLFACPNGITRAPDGSLFVVNFTNGEMLKVDADGEVAPFATIPGGGNGHVAYARGSLYVTGFQSQRIFRVSMSGDVTHIAGTGAFGEQDGPALEATFTWPNGIAAGPAGDRLYINDYLNRPSPSVAIPPTPNTTLRVLKLASLADELTAALRSGGIEALRDAHGSWKGDPATASYFTEVEMNFLGYQLMNTGQLEAALVVFELNTVDYPNSWNVWDSFGEAHMTAGNTDKALEMYEKSLQINPGNTNAQEMVAKLRSGS